MEVSENNNTAMVVIIAALKPTYEEMNDEDIKEKYKLKFEYKYMEDNKECIEICSYPLTFINDIKVLEDEHD